MKGKLTKLFKIIAFSITAVMLSLCLWVYNIFIITPFDRPWILSGEKETITVSYVNWACDCADFVQSNHYETNAVTEPDANDYIFIEPSNPDLQLKENFFTDLHFHKNIRLTGRFYIDKGIPASYLRKTPEKPEHAKVFRYDKLEFVEK